ncbi:MAG: ATP-dependent DNA helicase [Candidatus Omnitrophica bacterium]|nr:ATP-dependent DNA helicase [Candidatus Omnitrophota bacterium]
MKRSFQSEPLLEGLNEEQQEAVTHTEGPLLIIAGAGTGKTRVITRRIAWLINSGRATTRQILALTFTDKAATEMEERVDVLVPYGYTDIWISTFHAFGDRILRENAIEAGLRPDFKVLTRSEAAVFFRENLYKFNLSYYRPLSDPAHFMTAMIGHFSRAKDEDISSEEYIDYSLKLTQRAKEDPDDGALQEEALKQAEIAYAYRAYQELLVKAGKVDFANQFSLALQLLREHPAVLRRYQEQFKYILVDEFQDTNFAQFQLLKLLGSHGRNITVVADDDQCVFRFRGAAYSNIINFNNEYRDAKKISLIRNYRSTQPILDCAYRLIQHNNPERFEVKADINKRLVSEEKNGEMPLHMHFDTFSSEADAVARQIKEKAGKGGYRYNDFCILVRSNSDAEPFLHSLNMLSIPWRFSGNRGLYSREEVRLCVSFLRLMANINDSMNLYFLSSGAVYGVPLKDISECMHYSKRRNRSLFYVFEHLSEIPELQDISAEAKERIGRVVSDMSRFLADSRALITGRLLYLFLTDTGYIKMLVKEKSAESEEKIQNIAKFFELVRAYELVAREDRVIYFVNYLDLLIEAGDDPATQEADLDSEAVNILTIHKAKGLEFPVVFMVCLVAGRFPWPRRRQPIELPEELFKDILPSGDYHTQEERRLFYVGMTRAQKELIFTSALDYGGSRARRVSPFVLEALELPKESTLIKRPSLEIINRYKPPAEKEPRQGAGTIKNGGVLSLSYYQLDDYLTCPLKYKYIHILRIPIMEHHTVLYGKAMHEAVQMYYTYKMKGLRVDVDTVIARFRESFRVEGFLAQEHQDDRLKKGKESLKKFFVLEEERKQMPSYIEKEFSFQYKDNRLRGRWDRVDEAEEVVIMDFKSSEVKSQQEADKKAKDSLQLSLYALAYQQIYDRQPDYTALYFLETGLIGRAKKEEKDFEKIRENIDTVAGGIRQADFEARPTYMACSYCPYNSICPSAFK